VYLWKHRPHPDINGVGAESSVCLLTPGLSHGFRGAAISQG